MQPFTNNYLLARAKEHKLILESLGELESVNRFAEAHELFDKLRPALESFKLIIVEHHDLEHMGIFKAALEACPTQKNIELVLRLQKEHGIFEKTIDNMIFMVNFCENNQSLRLKLTNELNVLILMLKKHSLAEVKDLFPMIGSNARFRQLLDAYQPKRPADEKA